jgi:hypothetical protein
MQEFCDCTRALEGRLSVTAAIEANDHTISDEPGRARVIFKVDGALVGPT